MLWYFQNHYYLLNSEKINLFAIYTTFFQKTLFLLKTRIHTHATPIQLDIEIREKKKNIITCPVHLKEDPIYVQLSQSLHHLSQKNQFRYSEDAKVRLSTGRKTIVLSSWPRP
jgi:hypothetical protein